ncbi:MAG TPA: sugar phosphate isomerase/epimerase family protein [Solirubrobacteraceae bacterium]|nr:sugar phosphate isomerase/epimerase family protein [Solirubrobacteraceae bacterium]
MSYAGVGDEAGDDLDDQLDAIRRLGWDTVELRTVGGVAVADLDDRAFAALAATVSARGIEVVCVASQIGNWSRLVTGDPARDLDELACLAERCRTLGTRFVRVMSYRNDGLDDAEWGRRAVARLRELALRAEQAGLVLLHENCTGWAAVDPRRMLELVDAVGSPALGLMFDTGNGLAYGYDAHDILPDIVDHVRHVHVKDARGARGAPSYEPPGVGGARVADSLRLLLESGYAGAFAIEPHVVVRPHEATGAGAPDGSGAGPRRAGFLACGAALEELVRREVAGPGWTPVPGGIARECPR